MNNLHVKQSLNSQQLLILSSEYDSKKKDSLIMYLLWFFLGSIGAHRYYLGDVGRGIAMTLTLGGLGFWALIDVFFIGSRLKRKNAKLETNILSQIQASTPQQAPVA